MTVWIKYKLFEFWVWFGNRVLGWNTITLHNSKDMTKVIGVTFGETKEAK